MEKYENNLSEYYKKVVQDGTLIVKEEGTWDLFLYDDVVYSIPKLGSGGGASTWCSLVHLKRHLHYLQKVCNSPSIIPSYWNVVRPDIFARIGIMCEYN